MEPSVAIVSTWVSPRVKSPEPCVRGRRPTSALIGRISSGRLPSGLTPSFTILFRTRLFKWFSIAAFRYSGACFSPSSLSVSARTCRINSARSSLAAAMRSQSRDSANWTTASATSSGVAAGSNSNFGLPTRFCISSCSSMSCTFTSCALPIASRITASDTSFAPASTMTTASRVPATTISSALSFSWANVGLTTYSPLMYATRVPETGPPNGISDIVSAAEAPMIERMSGSFSWSADSVVTVIWTSFRMPLGKSGRSGRSVRRAVRMPAVLGRPSRRNQPPGIFPAAYNRSS